MGAKGQSKYGAHLLWSRLSPSSRAKRKAGIDEDDSEPLDGREITTEQWEFMRACYQEMRRLRKRNLTPRQVLRVAKRLGYVKREEVEDAL